MSRIMNTTHKGFVIYYQLTMALATANISSKRDSSCLCRPLVSTMIISKPSFLNISTPVVAITTGSTSV